MKLPWEIAARGIASPEGPAADREGHVFLISRCSGKVLRVDSVVLLGQVTTNSYVAKMLGQERTELSDQGIMLKTLTAPSNRLVVGGGSPIATLWAVYELGERLGVRYLCDRDVYPTTEPKQWQPLPYLDVVMTPNLRVRCWRLLNEHAMGPISWSLEENRRFLINEQYIQFEA